MFYKSYRKSEARAFDHLYDPIYTAGNQRDIQRENVIALKKTARINIYTNFNSMFSELPQRPRSLVVIQRNELPKTPENNGVHQRRDNDYASGRNRAKYFNIPLVTKSTVPSMDESKIVDNKKTLSSSMKPKGKSRSVSCQTIYREQSAQTKPYLPQIQYRPGIERSELFQVNDVLNAAVDSPTGLSGIKAINRRRKRIECEQILKQNVNPSNDEQRLIYETLEWEEWLTRENDIENTQLLRFRNVQEMLKQRDKLFESDSIKTIDHSISRLNNEHKLKIESINKKYERSIRKLRKFVYNQTKDSCCNDPNLSDTIQKVRHGNLNNSIMAADSRKYEMALSRIEKVGNFTTNYEAALQMRTPIDKSKNAIYEIMPGFLKDNNLRIVYEALKAYRLRQTIHHEISNKLKSIDKIRATIVSTNDDDNATYAKIIEYKNKIAEMLKILSHLKELLQNIQHISIDSFLDLLTHKFNVILTESSLNDLLLNVEQQQQLQQKMSSLNFGSLRSRDDISSAYLNDILRRCNEFMSDEKSNESVDDELEKNVMTDEVVRNILWPEVMNRLDNYLDNHRTKIKVDLKRLTTEEEAMVESIGNECVENIIDHFLKSKH